eukprot:4316766-Amphidinium_carterae.2
MSHPETDMVTRLVVVARNQAYQHPSTAVFYSSKFCSEFRVCWLVSILTDRSRKYTHSPTL